MTLALTMALALSATAGQDAEQAEGSPWHDRTVAEGGFVVEVPTELTERVETRQIGPETMEDHLLFGGDPGGVYFVRFHRLPGPLRDIPAGRFLGDRVAEFEAATGNQVDEREEVEVEGHPGIRFGFAIPPQGDRPADRGAALMMQADGTFVSLMVWGAPAVGSGDAARFLDSFRLLSDAERAEAEAEAEEAAMAEPPQGDVQDDGWRRVTFEQAGLSVLMPAEPERRELPIRTPSGPKTMHRLEARREGRIFSVGLSVLDGPMAEDEKPDASQQTIDNLLRQMGGELLSNEETELEGNYARDFAVRIPRPGDQPALVMRMKSLVAGRRVIDLSVFAPEPLDDPDLAARFLGSVDLLDDEGDGPASP